MFGQHPFHGSSRDPQERGNPLNDRGDRFAIARDDSLILIVRTHVRGPFVARGFTTLDLR